MHERFVNIIHSEKPVLVDFYADWCGPCKQMPPILKEVKEKFKDSIRVVKVNVDRNQPIAAMYQIQSIPTIMIFKNGKVCWKGLGVHSANVLSSQIQSFL